MSKSPSSERKTDRNHVQLLQFDPLQCLETSILSSTPAISSPISGNIGEGRAFCSVSFCIRRSNILKKSSYSTGPTTSTLSKSGSVRMYCNPHLVCFLIHNRILLLGFLSSTSNSQFYSPSFPYTHPSAFHLLFESFLFQKNGVI
ncbi:uncharacterized protein LOC131253867 [Magnolia sinica]|uniref:uncharacterized protein LOC131253867 n=1 Tax=Magnolia sinica TaxID=86752 RepID=UPI00265AC37E|nr:uncharacterized protein LOC131253867 [Magnolia sinica]